MSTKAMDSAGVVFDISANSDTNENNAWVKMLLKMYRRYCEQHGLEHEVVNDQRGHAALLVTGVEYARLKSEHGVHRLSRISPFDPNRRRHTSFAAVNVIEVGQGTTDSCRQPIRNYILSPHPAVVELRTGFTAAEPEKVLDGDLDQIVDAWHGANR